MDTLQGVKDISLHIFKFLPLKDAYSFAQINKEFYESYMDDYQWGKLLDRDYRKDNLILGTNYDIYKFLFALDKSRIYTFD
jgi:hypothetical protein